MIAAGGLYRENPPTMKATPKSANLHLHPHAGKIPAKVREQRHGRRGCVGWLTGLSAYGKSSIATVLERKLFTRGCQTFILDGDAGRRGLCSDLDFSERVRHENIRRVGEVAR